jgi:hypothetical protein
VATKNARIERNLSETIAQVNYRPILSSERVLDIKKPTSQTEKKNLVMSFRWKLDTKTD